MSVHDDATLLETLLPQMMTNLFWSSDADPLRLHSVGQIRLLRILFGGSKTATELSQSLGLSPSSLTQMAGRMIAAGLVSKELDTRDRRVRKLSLTPAGRNLMENRQSMRSKSAVAILENVPEESREKLIELVQEIHRLAAQMKPEGTI